MRKLLLGTTATAAALSFGMATASADVFTNWTVTKDKDITVTENIDIDKEIDLDVDVDKDADKFAESLATVNQLNQDNTACENCAEKRDIITGSILNNEGIVTVNQSAGNMNNQGTAIAFSFDVADPDPNDPTPEVTDYGFAEAQAHVEQDNDFGFVDSENILFRDSLITDSINNNEGIVYVNQAAGQLANQANVLSAAVSLSPGVALAEADLAQFNTNNTVFEQDVNKRAFITNAGNSNSGVIGVNQSSGVSANQSNIVSVAYTGALPSVAVPPVGNN